jgi:DNA-binding response OmpR family regulator
VEGGFNPDLVVTDLMMPHMGGHRLTRHLKGLEATQRVPVIMLTAKEGPRDVIDGIHAGARHYVTKPFHQDGLLAKVRRALNLE